MPSVSLHVRQQPVSDNSWQRCFKELLPVKPDIIMRNLRFVVWVWGRLAPEPRGCLPGGSAPRGKPLLYQAGRGSGQWCISVSLPVQCLFLENFSLKMLTSSQEQKQSRDEIYCDAESTCEINASLSSCDPSSLCFKSGVV